MNAPPDQPPNPFPKELLASMFSGPEPTEVAAEYIWGARPGHRDDLVRRDRYENGEHVERLYCLMDYFNPVAVIDAAGEVQERYAWSAIGQRTVLDPGWTPREESALAFEFGFHGQFLDEETGFYDYGFRYFSPELGRWLNHDPIGERGGVNLYAFVENRSVNDVDYLGLQATLEWKEIDLKKGDCGNFRWDIEWIVYGNANPVYIVQEIRATVWAIACSEGSQWRKLLDDTIHEAWLSSAANIRDTWSVVNVKSLLHETPCRGEIQLKATAGLLDDLTVPGAQPYTPDPLSEHYEYLNPLISEHSPANYAHFDLRKPGGEGRIPALYSPVQRSLKAVWDCCNGSSETTVETE